MQALLARSLELADQALAPAGDDLVLAGQTRLMGVQDLSDVERLRELFEAFARKREILQLLDRTVQAEAVRIFIGEETGMAPLEGVSLVAAPMPRADACSACWGDRADPDGLRPGDPGGAGRRRRAGQRLESGSAALARSGIGRATTAGNGPDDDRTEHGPGNHGRGRRTGAAGTDRGLQGELEQAKRNSCSSAPTSRTSASASPATSSRRVASRQREAAGRTAAAVRQHGSRPRRRDRRRPAAHRAGN